jgi:hypothetical protein
MMKIGKALERSKNEVTYVSLLKGVPHNLDFEVH